MKLSIDRDRQPAAMNFAATSDAMPGQHLLSANVQRMRPSATMQVSQLARELKAAGRDVISLATGEPDFPTPVHICLAAEAAMRAGKTKYTAVNGIVELREAIVATLRERQGLQYDCADVIVASGAKQVISNALIATLDPGDEVVIPTPCWVSYPEMVRMLGGVPVLIETNEPGLKLDPESLQRAIGPRTKWLLLNSPCNPSGATYSAAELRALADVLLKHPHVHVMSDDIYEHLVYDGVEFATMAQAAPELKERTLTVNGVSKAYAMTGWRIGYAAGPAALVKAMVKVQGQLSSGPNSIAQWAALAALTGPMDSVQAHLREFDARRRMSAAILGCAPGLGCRLPDGAFYLLVSCAKALQRMTSSGTRLESDLDFCTALLSESGVAAVPGSAFGIAGHFRVSFATDTRSLLDACGRIAAFAEALR